jgi:hypothetical protein
MHINDISTMRTHLGELEQILLLALPSGDEGYGVEIRRTIEERTGRSVAPGAVLHGARPARTPRVRDVEAWGPNSGTGRQA